MADFFLKNGYIDTSVQKGGIPGIPVCLEHTGVVTQLLREARENKGDLVVLWLDLANAFGSMPHKLVHETLERHQCSSCSKRAHSGLLQQFQSEGLSRINNI